MAQIIAENLGKRYFLGYSHMAGQGLRHVVEDVVLWPFRKVGLAKWDTDIMGRPIRTQFKRDEFWALKDVSFEVEEGEVLGIIGRNGAGKSTLLKILSRITDPTKGRVSIRGRVTSLLEVGTGFHPELTGKENVYLNASILGMPRGEIDKKFDEIVAFAEIERFINTPVKRYSSGMYTRLAFSVAAHLDPDVMVVDEVLAVGDINFQRKCIGRMSGVAKSGRTVLFVSHNMGLISNICTRAILLEKGEVLKQGDVSDVIREFTRTTSSKDGEIVWPVQESAPGSDATKFRAVRALQGGKLTPDIQIDEDFDVELEYWNLKAGRKLTPGIILLDRNGIIVLFSGNMPSACTRTDSWYGREFPEGLYKSRVRIPGNFLNEGTFLVKPCMYLEGNREDVILQETFPFNVVETGAMRREFSAGWPGSVRVRMDWTTEPIG